MELSTPLPIYRATLADSERLAFSIEEVAAMLGVSHWTVRSWIKAGVLKAARVHNRRKYLIPREAVEKLLDVDGLK